MTARDAVNTAPFTDHLFGAWDMLPVSSYGLPAGLLASLGPAVEHAFVPAGHEGPAQVVRKPSISAGRRHAPGSTVRTAFTGGVPHAWRATARSGVRGWVQEAAEPRRHAREATGVAGVERVVGIPLHRVAHDHVVGVERGSVVELDPGPELAGPDGGIPVRRARTGERRLDRCAVRFVGVERVRELGADERGDRVGLVGAVQA